jgi:hypothetical protein
LLTLAGDALAARPRGAPPVALQVGTAAQPEPREAGAVRLSLRWVHPWPTDAPGDASGDLPSHAALQQQLDLARRLLEAMGGELEVHQDQALLLWITLRSAADSGGD